MISFNEITKPSKVPFTYVEFSSSRALGASTAQKYKVLMLGKKLDSGSAPDGSPIGCTSLKDAEGKFGKDSNLYKMIEVYFRNNSVTELVVLPFTDLSESKTISEMFKNAHDTQFNVIINPYSFENVCHVVSEELKTRFKPEHSLEGIAINVTSGGVEACKRHAEKYPSPHMVFMGLPAEVKDAEQWAAALGAVIALHGNEDPARPFHTLPLLGVEAPEAGVRFTKEEQGQLLGAGVSTFSVAPDNQVVIQRLVTASQDESLSSVNTMLTLSFLRHSIRAYFARKYPRVKLASEKARIAPGSLMMTPQVMKAELISLFKAWEEQGLVEDIDDFKSELICERNGPDRIDVYLAPKLVGQLSIIAAKVEYKLT